MRRPTGLQYAPLHVHSDFSPMDGTATVEEYVDRAVELGMPALALTDHGSLSGIRQLHRIATDKGIKPIFGIEAYFCHDRHDKRPLKERTEPLDQNYFHLILIAANDIGYKNLCRMHEIAFSEGFYYKPRLDWEMLESMNEGIIALSGCMGGLINQCIEKNELGLAKEYVERFVNIFGDRYYIELMPHNTEGINKALIELADSFGIPVVVTPDCHHATVDQKVIQEIMLITGTHTQPLKDASYAICDHNDDMVNLDRLYGADRKMSFRSFDIHLLSAEEMWRAMGDDARPDMFRNTLRIADAVETYNVPRNLDLLPKEHSDTLGYLRTKCIKFLKSRGLWNKTYRERLDYELKVFADKGFENYFAVVESIIDFAKANDIMGGPGRGSAAGSLVCYALGITHLDPIEDKLIFERFLNPERNDYPDVDMDWPDSDRHRIREFLKEEYYNVANISTFGRFTGKNIVKDVSRVFCIPISEVDAVCKRFETWEEFLESNETENFRNLYPQVAKYGEALQGRIRQTGVHASGVVVSTKPLSELTPVEVKTVKGDSVEAIGLDMDEAADIGLIKFDVLGLKTLSVIQDTLRKIKERRGETIDLMSKGREDPNIYEMISEGNTSMVFQMEAGPYTSLLRSIGVRNFGELAATNALVRPGAANTIGKTYIARLRGEEMVRYPCPETEHFLEETYGCVLYQEQVMLMCTTIGGMSMAEADKVRKIIGKKKDVSEFKQFEEKFVTNASNFVSQSVAEKLWHDFEAHAGYSFNKSHAYAYSLLGYWTAWLKYYYPTEFIWSALKNETDMNSRTQYLIEAKRLGVTIRLPEINSSDISFSIIDDHTIQIGLSQIKWISENVAKTLIDNRPFVSYNQVETLVKTKGNGLNTRTLSSLLNCGALRFPDSPPHDWRSNLYEFLNLPESTAEIPDGWPVSPLSTFEEDSTYIFVGIVLDVMRKAHWGRVTLMDQSGTATMFINPSMDFEKGKSYLVLAGNNRVMDYAEFNGIKTEGSLAGFLRSKRELAPDESQVVAFQQRKTKKGEWMANVVLNTQEGLQSVVVFPSKFTVAYGKLRETGTVAKVILKQNDNNDYIFEGVKIEANAGIKARRESYDSDPAPF